MANGVKEAIYLRYMWEFIFPKDTIGSTVVFEDNAGSIHVPVNPATTPNSKHIDIRHRFLRERVAKGEFRVTHVPTALQRADFLTKPLPKEGFCAHRD